MTRYLFPIILLTFSACAEFPVGRSYLSEMDHDDSSFYRPNEDFPVVGGDDEVAGMSMDEYRRKRMPRSEEDKSEDRQSQFFRQELSALESAQSEEELEYYKLYKNKLASQSERIYYLKLAPGERRQYLQDRGFLEGPKRVPASFSNSYSRRNNEINLGMTKTDVMSSMGRPSRVEIAGNPSNENERWQYQMNGASKYIYFESGVVQGWD